MTVLLLISVWLGANQLISLCDIFFLICKIGTKQGTMKAVVEISKFHYKTSGSQEFSIKSSYNYFTLVIMLLVVAAIRDARGRFTLKWNR